MFLSIYYIKHNPCPFSIMIIFNIKYLIYFIKKKKNQFSPVMHLIRVTKAFVKFPKLKFESISYPFVIPENIKHPKIE